MLRKKERLTRESFNRFFSKGVRRHTPHFLLVHSPHETPHASVVVPKKMVHGAVERNRMRRRVYDIVRGYFRERNGGGVFIFIMKKGAEKATFKELKEAVAAAINKTR